MLQNYYWPGNIRQLKNVTEQISIIEKNKEIDAQVLKQYLPGNEVPGLPVLYQKKEEQHISERELLYKVLFEMKKDMTELKKIVASLIKHGEHEPTPEQTKALLVKDYSENILKDEPEYPEIKITRPQQEIDDFHPTEMVEESLSLQQKENELIKKALEKHHGKRKSAARELGISERTLYRKIKEYNIR